MASQTAALVLPERRASRGLWRDAFSRLLRNRPAVFGMICIAIFVGMAILAPIIAPYDPEQDSPGPDVGPAIRRAPGRPRQAWAR